MSLELFDSINAQVKKLTHELSYHIVGDPLVLSNLKEYLDISLKHELKVNIVTTANNLTTSMFEFLTHKAIRQVNFSLNSYNANSHKKSLQEYLQPIFEFAHYVQEQQKELFINFRLWNFDEDLSAQFFNENVFAYANAFFNQELSFSDVQKERPKSLRIAKKLFFHFDDYFNWPTLQGQSKLKHGFCYGLKSHFGILSSGRVVPCCLDKDGIIDLGNIHEQTLEDILNSSRVKQIQKGFLNQQAVEELCQKCEYKERFLKDNDE
nr:SPASM domain-containing protein [Candidatus Marinarcus aquaticus]